jgi:hypothetical protein
MSGSGGASSFAVRKDGQCQFNLGSIGIRSIAMVTPPRNGTVEISGVSFTYRPNPGYVGSDSFQIRYSNPNLPPSSASGFYGYSIQVR